MPLDTHDQDELEAIVRGAIRGDIPGADVSPGSDYDITARVAATAARLGQAQAAQVVEQIFPATADEEHLERHATRRAVTRRPAAKSRGLLQVASSETTPIPVGAEIEHDDETAYVTTEALVPAIGVSGKQTEFGSSEGRLIITPDTSGMAADQVYSIGGHLRAIREVIGGSTDAVDLYEPLPFVPAAGTALTAQRGGVIAIEAVEVGATGNKPIGDVLTFTDPVSGLTPEARVLELSGGGDQERVDELRGRVVDAEAEPPGAGNREQIRKWARETEGVRLADAIVFEGLRGLGTVDVVPIGVSDARRVGSLVAAAVLEELEARLPNALDVSVEPIDYDADAVEIDTTVTCGIGFEPDWEGELEIAATPASTTERIYVTADASDVMEVGDRVLVPLASAGGWRTYQRTVVAIQDTAGVAPFWIDLDEELPIAPTDADPGVFPGGPIAQPILDAIEAYFDALGPSAEASAAGHVYERHPDPSIAWDDTVRLGALSGAIKAVPGVLSPAIAVPTADVRPSALQVARLGQVILRMEGV